MGKWADAITMKPRPSMSMVEFARAARITLFRMYLVAQEMEDDPGRELAYQFGIRARRVAAILEGEA